MIGMEDLVPALLRNLDIPIFIEVGKGALRRLEWILTNYNLNFRHPLFLYGRKTFEIGARMVMEAFSGRKEGSLIEESDDQTVVQVEGLITERMHDVVIGIGGGRVLDVGKLAAAKRNIGFISVPTIPSNDGIASPVSVIKNGGENRSILARVPMGIIVDLDLMTDGPKRQLRAGVGDLIANLSAIFDWRLAFDENKDNYDPFAAMLSKLSVEGMINFDGPDLDSPEFIERLVMGLILSGIAMGIAGSSRPASGSEHEISHAIDHLFGGVGLHGEQVGVATRFSLHLQGQSVEKVDRIYEALSIPKGIADINLDIDKFIEAVGYAPKTRPDRWTILEKLNLTDDGIRKAAISSGIWSGSD